MYNTQSCFNSLFSGTKLTEKFRRHPEVQDCPTSEYQSLKFSEISLEFVHGQPQYLNCGKLMGVDNVNDRLLRDSAHIMAAPLINIMNN